MARYIIRRWHLHDETALFIGTAIVVVLVITLINGVLIRGFFAGANRVFQPQNTTTRAGIVQPEQPERSGSPTSFAAWATLGFQGRNFVATGPHAAELTRLNGKPAKEPIRVYVGLNSADSDESRMSVLMSELERTGAFDPQGPCDRPDDRHRLDQSGRGAISGDDVQRRYRDRRVAVFLSAELDLVPGGPAEVAGLRAADDRRHPRSLGAIAARSPAKAVAVRRKPRLDGRPGCLRVAARHFADGLLVGAVGRAAGRQSAVEGHHRTTRPGHARGRPEL